MEAETYPSEKYGKASRITKTQKYTSGGHAEFKQLKARKWTFMGYYERWA